MRVLVLLLTAFAITAADTTIYPTGFHKYHYQAVVTVAHTTPSAPKNLQHVTSHGTDPVVTVAHTTPSAPKNLQHVTSHGPVVTVVHTTASAPKNLQHVTTHGPDATATLGIPHAPLVTHPPTAVPNKQQHVPTHGADPGSHAAYAPQDARPQSGQGSVSEPIIHYSSLDSNAVHITCFSESGPLPIRYWLFINDKLRQEKVVYKSVAANFTISMTPGTPVYLNCTAISPTGEKSSKNVTIRVDPSISDPDSATTAEGAGSYHRDKDTGPEHLIPLQYILTSVAPEVLAWNHLVLIICGPILLVLLVIFIFVSYIRSRREQHVELEVILSGSRNL